MGKPLILFAFALLCCSRPVTRDVASGRSVTEHEAGYLTSDGDWRPCDPIDERERAVSGSPGWKPGCRKSERMGGVSLGDLMPQMGLDEDADICAGDVCGRARSYNLLRRGAVPVPLDCLGSK
jgi:hypothetical protein